jgi:uncharacterized membrane protein
MSSVATSISPPRAPSPVPPAPSGVARVFALDRLRGLALVAMVVHHLTDWLTGDARAVLPGWSSFAVTDVAAPAFFVAAGASASLFVAARRRRGMSRPRVAAEVVRRYALLVPIGLAFDWLLWRHPTMFGVIEALGFTVVAGAAVAIAAGPRLLPLVAAAVLVGGMLAEWAASGAGGWWADEFVAGKFPAITYTGFVLVGMAAVRTGRFADRRWGLTAAAVTTAGVAVLLALGVTPDRYPGGPDFVVPGLAGTALVYAVAQCGWPARLARVDRLVQAAAAHTLGIFLAHYAVYYVLVDRTGLAGTVPGAVALPISLVTAVLLAAVAPRVPQAPWSLRTGRRRRPQVRARAEDAQVTLPAR